MDLKRPVNSDPRRNLPPVDRVVQGVRAESPGLADWAVRRAVKQVLSEVREGMSRGETDRPAEGPGQPEAQAGVRVPDLDELVAKSAVEAKRLIAPHPRTVINATGVVLHTNLGRAPMAEAARQAVAEAAGGYSNLELDLETGRRGSRMGRLEAKLVELSGAEAAHVVNNCAAAILLALNTLALGRRVVVSRGELVEIGGSFRVPAIMERAGVELQEIGTTNRTHLADYANAIDERTALLLKVHRSNFEQRGFTAEADLQELADLAHEHGIPLVEDLGSGTLLDLTDAGLPEESLVPARLRLGIDLLCFSGDKLLGGPQAGILLGRADLIEKVRKNPLARALRVDKLTIAALDATLDLMLDPTRSDEIPVVAGLRAQAQDLEPRARALRDRVAAVLGDGWTAEVAESESVVGGGSLPEHRLVGCAVRIAGPRVPRVARRLRAASTPVLVRVHDDALWLDVRTLRDDEFPAVVDALSFALL